VWGRREVTGDEAFCLPSPHKNKEKKEHMKKLAIIAASLICFAGCARNDTEPTAASGEYGATDTNTAVGTPSSSEIGRDNDLRDSGTPAPMPSPGLTNNILPDPTTLNNIDTNTNTLNRLPAQPEPTESNSQSPETSQGGINNNPQGDNPSQATPPPE
jgi:hypothetical protein